MKKKILFTRPLKLAREMEIRLAEEWEIVISPGSAERDFLPLLSDIKGIIAHGSTITDKTFQAAPSLEVVATPQVGFDKIDVPAATRAAVAVVANVGLAPDTVAEFTLGLMIALARRIVRSDHDLRQSKDWSIRAKYADPALDMGIDLKGATVGLVGFGFIGSAVARLCRAAFSARVLAYDPFVDQRTMSDQGVEKRSSLIDLAKEVDILSLHVALTAETRHLINEDVLRVMKPCSFLINCARGEVVDEKALVAALQHNCIAGAAIDVLEEEPINPLNPLLSMPNVIVTPHIAGISVQSSRQRGEEIVKRLLDFFAGRKPQGLVNPEVWPGYLQNLKINRSTPA